VVHHKKISFLLLTGLFLSVSGVAHGVSPDFNADRRINIKCPAAIDETGQFQTDGFMSTLRRLYNELDENLKSSERKGISGKYGSGYSFSDNPNEGIFYITHAKATFPAGNLGSLSPSEEIRFQEVFLVKSIDWEKQELELIRQRDKRPFTINIPDFEKGFIWYNALLDKDRAYIPVYGFLSLPGEANEFPVIWDGWESNKKDTATPPESLVDYDFYKVLDYRDGYYLLAKDFYEFDYRANIEDFGIIGWVEKDYITLWRSRLYYHPMKEARFFDDRGGVTASPETDEINRFYVDHAYLKESLFSDIVEKLDQENLHRFYTHFGFPQLSDPEYSEGGNSVKVFIPGAFTPRLMRLLNQSMKRNLNTFFLLDISQSMKPFADYVKSFNKSVNDMEKSGIALRANRIYTYRDSSDSDADINAKPDFERVKRAEDLKFGEGSKDKNYDEPLMRAFGRTLDEIAKLQEEKVILPLQEKLLFIITDAGANDLTDDTFSMTVKRAKDLNVKVYLIHPSDSGVRVGSATMDDTPEQAYGDLVRLISSLKSKNPEGGDTIFRDFEFNAKGLLSQEGRQKDFSAQHKDLLEAIQAYMDHIFTDVGKGELPKDIILYFSDERLLTEMRNWSDRRIQVLNHVIKHIRSIDNPSLWEERIAIPAKPVESFLRAIRSQDDVSLSDLKKLVIINSLVSVDDIDRCRTLYDYIKPLIEKRTSESADDIFYKALTRRQPAEGTSWNKKLGEESGPLAEYLAEREFHLNSFNQAVQRKFMYIKVNELYKQNR
jgi:hypothetical protein